MAKFYYAVKESSSTTALHPELGGQGQFKSQLVQHIYTESLLHSATAVGTGM